MTAEGPAPPKAPYRLTCSSPRKSSLSPIYPPLAALVLYTFGPAQVLAEEFDDVRGLEEMHIFGSWASRYNGEPGLAPADLDVIAVGSPDRDEIYERAVRAEKRLQREVNVTTRSREAWTKARDGFVRQVRSSSLVPVLSRKRR